MTNWERTYYRLCVQYLWVVQLQMLFQRYISCLPWRVQPIMCFALCTNEPLHIVSPRPSASMFPAGVVVGSSHCWSVVSSTSLPTRYWGVRMQHSSAARRPWYLGFDILQLPSGTVHMLHVSDVSQAGPTTSAALIRETQSDQTEISVVAWYITLLPK